MSADRPQPNTEEFIQEVLDGAFEKCILELKLHDAYPDEMQQQLMRAAIVIGAAEAMIVFNRFLDDGNLFKDGEK